MRTRLVRHPVTGSHWGKVSITGCLIDFCYNILHIEIYGPEVLASGRIHRFEYSQLAARHDYLAHHAVNRYFKDLSLIGPVMVELVIARMLVVPN